MIDALLTSGEVDNPCSRAVASTGSVLQRGPSPWPSHAKVVRVFTRVLESRRSRHPSESRWHRAVAPGVEVGEITTHGLALSRLKHGFESRREGPKEVRSSLRRQSFSSDSKREVIAPARGRTRRGFAPATRQLREAESRLRGAGEGEGIAHRLVKDRQPFLR